MNEIKKETKVNKVLIFIIVLLVLIIIGGITFIMVNKPLKPSTPEQNITEDNKQTDNVEKPNTSKEENTQKDDEESSKNDTSSLQNQGQTTETTILKVAGKEFKIEKIQYEIMELCATGLKINGQAFDDGCGTAKVSAFNDEFLVIKYSNSISSKISFYDTSLKKVKEFSSYNTVMVDNKIILFNSERDCEKDPIPTEAYENVNMYVYEYKNGQFSLEKTFETALFVMHEWKGECIEKQA